MRHIRLTAIFFLQAISTWATAPSRIAAFATTLIVLFLIDVWFHSSGKNKFCTEFQTEPVYVYTSGTTWWVRRSAEVPTIPPILSQPALSNKKMTFGLLSFVFCLLSFRTSNNSNGPYEKSKNHHQNFHLSQNIFNIPNVQYSLLFAVLNRGECLVVAYNYKS